MTKFSDLFHLNQSEKRCFYLCCGGDGFLLCLLEKKHDQASSCSIQEYGVGEVVLHPKEGVVFYVFQYASG